MRFRYSFQIIPVLSVFTLCMVFCVVQSFMKKEAREPRIQINELELYGKFSFGVIIGDDGYCYNQSVAETDNPLLEMPGDLEGRPKALPMPSTSYLPKSMNLVSPLIRDLPKQIEIKANR